MKQFLLTIMITFAAVSLVFCQKTGKSKVEKFPADPITIDSVDASFNETTKFLSAIDIALPSPLAKVTQTKEYQNYRLMIDKSWSGFLSENMKKISEWRSKFMKGTYKGFVFYPFSGPDILHPLLFYPDASDILMFGLEPIGEIPDALNASQADLLGYIRTIPAVMNFTLQHAFFVTSDMQKTVGKQKFSGISGIMMFFLGRGGYDVLQVRKIFIDNGGNYIYMKKLSDPNLISGVEIIFRKGSGGELKRARYFQLDISNKSPKLNQFILFCSRYASFVTIVKSASYLMHDSDFTKIRGAVLHYSSSILQDDSGVPYKHLNDGKWKLTYHGKYHDPIPVFSWALQNTLKKAVAKYTTGPLPFKYGYGYGYTNMTYHLVHAEKAESIEPLR